MPIQLNSPGWRIRTATRGAAVEPTSLPTLPPEFLTTESRIAEEVVLEPAMAARGRSRDAASTSDTLDLSYDLQPGQTAILAIRHPSGALTFHKPVHTRSRGVRGPSQVRFHVALRRTATRGLIDRALKAIVIKVAEIGADRLTALFLPKLVEAFERSTWKKRGLKEGFVKVTKDGLTAGALETAKPVSPERSLLLIHGTFSNAAAAFKGLATSTFFDRVKDAYGDRIFAFDHFSLSRTPEENARMLLEALPDQPTTFDVVTHSRGGLVLRNLVERTTTLGDLARRFKLGRAVLVASPNDGTPLATPERWEDTVGWIANLIELFPIDNPFTSGAAFVANGLVWIANHASGDIPGLHSMDGEGDPIATLQSAPGPPANAYSALVANYQPTDRTLQRLLDAGIDQFFGSANDLVVPSEGGWRVDRSTTTFIPATRIGCFGPGGNVSGDSVTHVSFFTRPETADFLVTALSGRPQPLDGVDPRKPLPDRRLLRAGIADVAAVAKAKAPLAAAPTAVTAGIAAPTGAADAGRLRITVTNGDLTFEREALLIGHYQATRLAGTEKVMDSLIGGAMAQSLDMGVYPVAAGTHKIFVNTRPNYERSVMPRPKAVIVVGLGAEGKLSAADLAHTVKQAVIGWAQRLVEARRASGQSKVDGASFGLAATLIGSGGSGVTAGEAARLVAQGVFEANLLLQNEPDGAGRWPRVNHLRFIELYLDRAAEAWRALRLQEAATPGRYAVDPAVESGTGPLLRPPDSGYRGADYDFITVETRTEASGTSTISYTLDTRRARSEVRAQHPQSQLLRELVATASNDKNPGQPIGRTLFNLLIPVELEAYLAGSGEMQIDLDSTTAGIPWELLDTNSVDQNNVPWSIRVRLLRRLRIQQFRERVIDADADASALVIGEPECPANFPRLYGARAEAIAVRGCLASALEESMVMALISADVSEVGANARAVINALFEKPWRIVHISGHGMPMGDGTPGGVVLSNGTFLGPAEIRSMRTVPELVFINCCHLASVDAGHVLNYDRAGFASGVAGALIEIGVRCVVAAGWAVDDDAAKVFAEAFYASLLRGNRFIVAVGEARTAAYSRSPELNTWAAYQCYGDPNWVFRRRAADPNQETPTSPEDFSGIASAQSLKLAVQRIIVQTKFQGEDPTAQLDKLRLLEAQLQEREKTSWNSGDVAELFGEGFVECGALETGMQWYQRAVAAQDGRASMRAAEQLANV